MESPRHAVTVRDPFKLLRAFAFRLLAFGLRHLAGTRTSHCFTQDPSPFLTPDLHPYTNHSLSLIRYITLHVTSSRLFLPRTLREAPGPGSPRPHRAMRDWTVPHARSRHSSRPLHAIHRPAAPHTCTRRKHAIHGCDTYPAMRNQMFFVRDARSHCSAHFEMIPDQKSPRPHCTML